MPQPITTKHTSLTSDKCPVLEHANTKVHYAVELSSAAQRSVDILQKFWGDYTTERNMNLTMPVKKKVVMVLFREKKVVMVLMVTRKYTLGSLNWYNSSST
jgi:hypothetical protein